MDLLCSNRFDGFCLVLSDSDFTRLAVQIQEVAFAILPFETAAKDKEIEKEKEECLTSLSFDKTRARELGITSAYLNTCEWLPSTKQYRLWWDRKHLESHNVDTHKAHNQDIALYVEANLKTDDPEIEATILRKVSGVFMWAVLVTAMLNKARDKGHIDSLHQRINQLPDDMDALFQMLLDLDDEDRAETVVMFQWVLFARRQLRVEELYQAVMSPPELPSKEDMQRRIEQISKDLLEVQNGRVQFVHRSVADFLLRNQRLQQLSSILHENPVGTSHCQLRDRCLSYLMMEEKWQVGEKHDQCIGKMLRKYVLFEYAVGSVFFHSDEARAAGIVQEDFSRRLQQHSVILKWVGFCYEYQDRHQDKHDIFGHDGTTSVIYASLVLRYTRLAENLSLPEHGGGSQLLNIRGGLYGNALQVAVALGYEEAIVTMLLDNGADINLRGAVFGTALQASIVQL
ncbi:hypothetical protein QBC38DRAFT_457759 [Podospora fimiseda]|uniref:Uncharacterized protein n=1 Tax=Podospora fimiseda TaxID=252190 RepID=A0AAN7BKH2_9PEZI|nr:hypothetical protein QBC38DRAFT_457759 [Podospora fimiseda]